MELKPDDTAITPDTGDDHVLPDAAPATTTTKPDATSAKAPESGVDGQPVAAGAGKAGEKPASGDESGGTPDWPEDWRDKAAGGDAKKLARLARYASPQAVADALIEVQNKMSSTRAIPPLKKDSTPEQIKEYRESMGIPETPDKYDLEGYTIAENDKPLIEQFLQKAHATNQTPEQVRAGIDAFYEIQGGLASARHDKDVMLAKESEDALRAEWGEDFRRNVNLINGFLDGAPEGFKDRFFTGRLSDGTPIASDPDALRWLLSLELERNPVGVVTPGVGGNMKQSVDDEIAVIEKAMRENRTAYNKDEVMQNRYRQLLEYRLNAEKKGSKAA